MAIITLQGEDEKQQGIRYEVDTSKPPIGEGGTGKVYAGRCVNEKNGTSQPVAIKFMFDDLDSQIIERARREAQIRLRNDNLVLMMGFIETSTVVRGEECPHYHVVSELLEGVSLADLLATGMTTDVKGQEVEYANELLEIYQNDPTAFTKIIAKSVLGGLMALHDAGYIHRDIDPSNIMITADRHIKLIDYGICKQIGHLTTHDKPLTVVGRFMGKPEYAAPELAEGDVRRQDQTTDIYAVGVMLYQCMTGKLPFTGKMLDILEKQIRQPLPVENIADKGLRRIVAKACAKAQEKRYISAAQMRVDIEALDDPRLGKQKSNKTLILGIIAAVVIAAGIALAVVMLNNGKDATDTAEQTAAELTAVTDLQKQYYAKLGEARQHADRGRLHQEGYDTELVMAARLYKEAADIAEQLAQNNVETEDIDAEVAKLREELLTARHGLTEKLEILADDPDFADDVREIEQRIETINEVTEK